KSLLCRLLLTSNIHTKFQVSSSYRSRDILTTKSKNAPFLGLVFRLVFEAGWPIFTKSFLPTSNLHIKFQVF
ncbi:hypothetical protein WDU94_011603, partial [Cyamophila willieti]